MEAADRAHLCTSENILEQPSSCWMSCMTCRKLHAFGLLAAILNGHKLLCVVSLCAVGPRCFLTVLICKFIN